MRTRTWVLGIAAVALALSSSPHATGQEIGDPIKGLAYAKAACAECHAVEPGQRSPNSSAQSFEALAAVPGMSSTALYAVMQTSHRTMPNLILEADDQRNVISYILGLKERR